MLNPGKLIEVCWKLFSEPVEKLGFILEDITFENQGREKFLTVYVDSSFESQSSINLDNIAEISRTLSQIIDNDSNFGEQAFNFEVTTPGVDRPLALPRHWKKNLGRLVNITFQDGNRIKGRINSASDDEVVVEDKSYPYLQIKKALIEIEFKAVKSKDGDNGN